MSNAPWIPWPEDPRVHVRRLGPAANHLDIAPLFRLDAHAEDACHVLIVERGTLVQRVDGRSVDLAAGSVRISPPGARQRATYGEHGARCLSIHLDPACSPDALDAIEVWSTVAWRRWARAVSAQVAERVPLDLDEIEAAMVSLRGRDAIEARASWLESVRDQLADESRRPPGLAELAARVGRSRSQVARGFKEAFGCTIGQFVRRRRVDVALALIGRGAALSDAALGAGFVDHAHMHRHIVAHTGRTPAAVARRATPLQDSPRRERED